MTTEITEQNFDSFVMKSDKPVMVDFWASWCGPCRAVAPIIEKISDDYAGKINVGKINVDEQPTLAEKFHVMSIPTIYIFKGGEVQQRLVGSRPYEELAGEVDTVLNA